MTVTTGALGTTSPDTDISLELSFDDGLNFTVVWNDFHSTQNTYNGYPPNSVQTYAVGFQANCYRFLEDIKVTKTDLSDDWQIETVVFECSTSGGKIIETLDYNGAVINVENSVLSAVSIEHEHIDNDGNESDDRFDIDCFYCVAGSQKTVVSLFLAVVFALINV